jgi:YidC/Oxa1 family membrane protein insertase
MFDFLAGVIAFFYDLWPSYGMAIVLFTLAIMLVLTPLSIKSTRSMIAMQRVQPELKKLQTKYKDDKEALQREMMAFYQANNINPFSSCLPLLLQMPVFFVLFRVLRGLTGKTDSDGHFVPSYLHKDSDLYQALRHTRQMVSWGMDLSHSASKALANEGVVKAMPFLILVGLVVLTSWFQQRQIQGRNPSAAANPQQQMIAKVMPFIFVPISFGLPAGVVIYFVVSNAVRIGQQAIVTRLEYPDRGDDGGDGAAPKAPKSPAPAAAVAPKSPVATGGNRAKNRKKKRK